MGSARWRPADLPTNVMLLSGDHLLFLAHVALPWVRSDLDLSSAWSSAGGTWRITAKRQADGGPLRSLGACHALVPRQSRCAACSARQLAAPLRVTGPLRGRGDELITKRSPAVSHPPDGQTTSSQEKARRHPTTISTLIRTRRRQTTCLVAVYGCGSSVWWTACWSVWSRNLTAAWWRTCARNAVSGSGARSAVAAVPSTTRATAAVAGAVSMSASPASSSKRGHRGSPAESTGW